MKKYNWIFLFVFLFAVVGTQRANAQLAAGSYIKVLSPNGGETLEVGKTYRITWQASSNIDKVALGYSFGPGSLNWICFSCANTGYYDWTVNIGNTANTQLKIDITGYETGKGSLSDQSDNYFTIPSKFQNNTTTSTTSTQSFRIPAIYTITPSSGPVLTQVAFTGINFDINTSSQFNTVYWKNLATGAIMTQGSDYSDGGKKLSFGVPPQLIPGNYEVWLINPNGSSNKVPFTVTGSVVSGKFLKIIFPNGGELYSPGNLMTIMWSSYGLPLDSVASISLVNEKTNTSIPLTGSFINSDRLNLLIASNSYTFTLPTTIQPGTYNIRIECLEAKQNSNAYCDSSNPKDDSDNHITILSTTTQAIATVITSPKSGDIFYPGQTINISWSPASPGVASINFKPLDGRESFNVYGDKVHGDSVNTTGNITYKLPEYIDSLYFKPGNYQLEIKLADGNSVTSGVFSLQNKVEASLKIYVNSEKPLLVGKTYKISWTGSDPGVSSYLVHFNKEGEDKSIFLGTAYTSQGSFDFSVPLNISIGSKYRISFSTKGSAGGTSEPYLITTSSTENQTTPPTTTSPEVAALLKQIEELKKQIAILQEQAVGENNLPNETTSFSYNWQNPLYVGMKNNEDVRALQNALLLEKVYTGPVTGNFGPLTLAATKAFQEKYGITPVTGFVGELTRAKLNELY